MAPQSHNNKVWRTELNLYQRINRDYPSIQIPADRVLNTLSFIKGPAVAAWVDEQLEDLDQNVVQWLVNSPNVWTTFKQNMDQAFTDVLNKDLAMSKLVNLTMAEEDLDTYNTQFNQLVRDCEWEHDDGATIALYKKGLNQALFDKILDKEELHPKTLVGWQTLAIKHQAKFLEKKHELHQLNTRDPNKMKVHLLNLL